MKILALIPARGGSKRIPRKNIKVLGHLPLIAWTIQAAKESGVCCAIEVSTDDAEIAEISLKYGANILEIRPPHLAEDTTKSVDVAVHFLDIYEQQFGSVDGLLLLQPTSPFRTAETIKLGVSLFKEHEGRHPIVGVTPTEHHPAWCFKIEAGQVVPFLGWNNFQKRSQDLEESWSVNGAFYLIDPTQLRQEKTFITSNSIPLKMKDTKEVIDIDSFADWSFAESKL